MSTRSFIMAVRCPTTQQQQ